MRCTRKSLEMTLIRIDTLEIEGFFSFIVEIEIAKKKEKRKMKIPTNEKSMSRLRLCLGCWWPTLKG